MVENLISGAQICRPCRPDEGQRPDPAVLMRGTGAARPHGRGSRARRRRAATWVSFSSPTTSRSSKAAAPTAVAAPERASTRVALWPRAPQDRTRQGGGWPQRAWTCTKSKLPTATATPSPDRDRYASPSDQPGLPSRPAQCGAALRRGRDVFPPLSGMPTAASLDRAGRQQRGKIGLVSGKAWVNQILESNPVPVIWVTNRIEQIDPAFRRRFRVPPGLVTAARRPLNLVAARWADVPVTACFRERLMASPGSRRRRSAPPRAFAQLASQPDARAPDRPSAAQRRPRPGPQTPPPRGPASPVCMDPELTESRFDVARIVQACANAGASQMLLRPASTGKTAWPTHRQQTQSR